MFGFLAISIKAIQKSDSGTNIVDGFYQL